jgi:hypothetical protein
MDFFERNRVKTFEDLIFEPDTNPYNVGSIQAKMKFENGHSISVLGGGQYGYGDGVSTFETWTTWEDDVQGWLSKDEVTELMLETQYKRPSDNIIGFSAS